MNIDKLKINSENLKNIKKYSADQKKTLTGYPSKDLPWLQYYSEEQINYEIPKCTCYELLYNNNKDKLDDIAIDYFGNKITYKKLFENIENTAKAYQSLGVKKGDIVSFLAIDTPEIIYSFYALNRLGAISNMVDPRSNGNALEKYFNEVNSEYVVTISNFRKNILEIIDKTNVKKIIDINAVESAPRPIRLLSKIKGIESSNDERVVDWKNFIKSGKTEEIINDFPYKENYPASIVHTGGTTGKPKGVLLSNDNFTAVVYETYNTPFNLERQDKFLNILVPFVAFGLALGMHAPMSLGWKSILIPNYTIDKMQKLIRKYKPQLVMGTQTYFEPLVDYKKYNYKNTKAMLIGGMPTKAEFEKELNDTIMNNGGSFMISKGYSMTEASSMGTCSYNKANKPGSNGVPLSKTVVAAFKEGTDEELKYNEVGEICLKTPTMMLGYYNNPEETSKVIKKHSNGEYWVHSGDLGYVDEDGFVFIKDRIKRMIIKSGFKVFPSEIENSFMKHPDVKNCSVVGMDDEVDNKVPVAFIIPEKEDVDIDKLGEELKEYIYKDGLPVYFEPKAFFVVDKFPITNVGKVDYRKLEERANELHKNQIKVKKK